MSKSTTNNTLNNVDCVIINTIPLMIKEYNNHRVVTFKDIDTVHERPEGTARKRFNDNREHFIEGVDFFKVPYGGAIECPLGGRSLIDFANNLDGYRGRDYSGYIYLAQDEDSKWYKIGRTSVKRNVEKRLDLARTKGLVNYQYFECLDTLKADKLIKERLQDYQVKNSWYNCKFSYIVSVIEQSVKEITDNFEPRKYHKGGYHGDITLITESGYLMLVKSFTDELAWQVQRELVNTYFRAKEMLPMVQGLEETLLKMQSEINGLKSSLESKPTQPNYWLWKKHIANNAIESVATALNTDARAAYDMVYDNMSAVYGFDKSFAINQFCVKYGVETTPVIDAIADSPQYQSEFVQAVNNLLDRVAPQEQVVKQLPQTDKVQSVIDPLIKKLGDKSVNGARTYGKVYSIIATARVWKSLLTRYRCSTKKQVLMKNDKKYSQFVSCVNKLLREEV